ncbi:hypothetical protein OXPF_23640 [Oxobacter pfennigii]|uniref:Uncharacterized protein n=1 Tax=Oxobacter pfennigii TaxID=36849 RepID=A0A0P8W913_9CLOT|nr:hypothetical protein [Oxobacter pfennigii]KPU44196.1 hypothetical protein OXPF_23640 [Oxobacter pfennigii]
MDKNKILETLRQSQVVEDIEEIKYKPDFLVARFFYVFDSDETEAAQDYANSMSDQDENEDAWYEEHYIPYLIDIAVDEVRDVIEDMVDDTGLNAEYVSYEPDREDDRCEFLAVFADGDKEFDIDEVLDNLEI